MDGNLLSDRRFRMSTLVEPFVVITPPHRLLSMALGIGASGVVVVTMKWSFRGTWGHWMIPSLNWKWRWRRQSDKQQFIELSTMSRNECTTCRKECQDRMVEYQRIAIENDRIQNQSWITFLMMVANVHNGMGGVATGLSAKSGQWFFL